MCQCTSGAWIRYGTAGGVKESRERTTGLSTGTLSASVLRCGARAHQPGDMARAACGHGVQWLREVACYARDAGARVVCWAESSLSARRPVPVGSTVGTVAWAERPPLLAAALGLPYFCLGYAGQVRVDHTSSRSVGEQGAGPCELLSWLARGWGPRTPCHCDDLLACLPDAYSGHVLAISDANSTGRSTG